LCAEIDVLDFWELRSACRPAVGAFAAILTQQMPYVQTLQGLRLFGYLQNEESCIQNPVLFYHVCIVGSGIIQWINPIINSDYRHAQEIVTVAAI